MASPLTHAFTGAALGTAFWRPGDPKRLWVLGAFCAFAPDLDAFGFLFRIPYASMLGHRGFSHSLTFALLLGLSVGWLAFDDARRKRACLYLVLATATHGLLDSMTSEGLGVGFFMPFWDARFFLPWRPIVITPLDVPDFPFARGFMVREIELWIVWLPVACAAALTWFFRRRRIHQGA